MARRSSRPRSGPAARWPGRPALGPLGADLRLLVLSCSSVRFRWVRSALSNAGGEPDPDVQAPRSSAGRPAARGSRRDLLGRGSAGKQLANGHRIEGLPRLLVPPALVAVQREQVRPGPSRCCRGQPASRSMAPDRVPGQRGSPVQPGLSSLERPAGGACWRDRPRGQHLGVRPPSALRSRLPSAPCAAGALALSAGRVFLPQPLGLLGWPARRPRPRGHRARPPGCRSASSASPSRAAAA